MSFDDVRKQLQAKNLDLGLWLQAVINGEVTPFKLRLDGGALRSWGKNLRQGHFHFMRDLFSLYA